MRVLGELRDAPRPSVAAVGNFDGVHLGHQELVRGAVAEARRRGVPALGISFEPHPSRILQPERAPALITPAEEKIRLLSQLGLDALLLLAFTRDLSRWTAREFVERVLVGGLGVVAVHEGENFRFGHRGQGDITLLQGLGEELGFSVSIAARVEVDGAPVSSSRIRTLVAEGRVREAGRLLGRPFTVAGLIAPGRGVGRQHTVPTLNLQPYEELLPSRGVYLTRAGTESQTWTALTNVGVRPTFGAGGPLTVETHLLHPPAGGIPTRLGERLSIEFVERLRDERKFESPEALRAQIQADVEAAETFFAGRGVS